MQTSHGDKGNTNDRSRAGVRAYSIYLPSVLLTVTLFHSVSVAAEQSRVVVVDVTARQGDDSLLGGMDSGSPPQPKGIQVVKWESDPIRSGRDLQEDGLARAEQLIRHHARSQPLLGRRYTHIDTVRLNVNGQRHQDGLCATYFSHSRNRSVELELGAGGEVKVRQDIAASTFQPELTHSEIAEAVELARSELTGKGFHRVSLLQAFGILPYQSDGDQGYYENRMVYVTFHERRDARPEFNALVDLTHQVVVESHEDRF